MAIFSAGPKSAAELAALGSTIAAVDIGIKKMFSRRQTEQTPSQLLKQVALHVGRNAHVVGAAALGAAATAPLLRSVSTAFNLSRLLGRIGFAVAASSVMATGMGLAMGLAHAAVRRDPTHPDDSFSRRLRADAPRALSSAWDAATYTPVFFL